MRIISEKEKIALPIRFRHPALNGTGYRHIGNHSSRTKGDTHSFRHFYYRKTKAWNREGTDDLRPYIYGKTLIIKWATTLIGYPVIAAILAGIMSLIIL